MGRKGQLSDNTPQVITSWCPACWFRFESQFDSSVNQYQIRNFFWRMHTAHNDHRTPRCTLAPRIPRFDGPMTTV
jgi:hypothetical protein